MENGTIREILINDNYVRNVTSLVRNDGKNSEPIKVDSIIRTKDFMKFFNSAMNLETGLLPNNCRFMKTIPNGKKIYVLEDEPKLRTVTFNFDPTSMLEILKQNGKYETFNLNLFKPNMPFKLTLSVPYVVYILILDDITAEFELSLFYRLSPITSLDDYLLEPCLPNISEDFKVCLGPLKNNNGTYININNQIKDIIDSFWFNSFNYDYFSHCKKYAINPELSDLFTYSYNSKKDPMFVFSTKWFDTGKTLNDIINKHIRRNHDSCFEDIFDNFQSCIEKTATIDKDNEYTIEKRRLAESVCLANNFVISVGDELILNNKKYYVNSFKYNQYGDFQTSVLEDEDGNISEFDINNDDFLKQIQLQFDNKELETITLSDNTILKKGDVVYFYNNEHVSSIEKIIQLKDGMKHIKIGNDFYLESSFLNKNLSKFDGIIEFGGVTLTPEEEYSFIQFDKYYSSIIFQVKKLCYKKYEVSGGGFCLIFHDKTYDRNIKIMLGDSKYYKKIDEKIIKKSVDLFRINDQIATKEIHYIDKFGLVSYGDFDDSVLTSSEKLYNSIAGIKWFTEFYNSKNEEFCIKSFDFDISYKIGDNVIYINWKEPETMLKIHTISGFMVHDDHFVLSITDDSGNSRNVPLINLINGQGYFTDIRHVCDQINEIKVGMLMKPNVKGIQDFPMNRNYEIKAFITDSDHPLVLFSNGRTLYFQDLMNKFIIVDKNKKSVKPAESFNFKIKNQDGDIFNYNDNNNQLIYSRNSNKMYTYRMSPCGYYAYKIIDIGSHLKSRLKNNIEMKRGLLNPRIEDSILKTLNVTIGHPSIFSEVIIPAEGLNFSYGVRRNLPGSDSEA